VTRAYNDTPNQSHSFLSLSRSGACCVIASSSSRPLKMGDFSLFLATLSKLLSSESFLKMKKWIRRDVHCSQCSLARHWRSRSTTKSRSRDPGRQPKLEKQDFILAFLDQQAVNPFFDLKRLNKEAPLIGYGSISQW
jgi:hypothetical protein